MNLIATYPPTPTGKCDSPKSHTGLSSNLMSLIRKLASVAIASGSFALFVAAFGTNSTAFASNSAAFEANSAAFVANWVASAAFAVAEMGRVGASVGCHNRVGLPVGRFQALLA